MAPGSKYPTAAAALLRSLVIWPLLVGAVALVAVGTVPVPTASATTTIVGGAVTPGGSGSWVVDSDGDVVAEGDASSFGGLGATALSAPVVGMAASPDGGGYWLVTGNGGVFSFGDAHSYGSAENLDLAQSIVAMAPTPDGEGYWLLANDGAVFAFGDAHFYGNGVRTTMTGPLVGIAASPDGDGYWLVARDGNVFAFGDATLFGGLGTGGADEAIVGLAATPDGKGYWLAGASGSVFSFGDATFYGSATTTPSPTLGIVADAPGGYFVLTAGGSLAFGPQSSGPTSLAVGSGAAAATEVPAIGADGTELTLDGAPYSFVGVNAYEIGTDWAINAGCGPMPTDEQLDQLFSSLPPDSLVRFWALQATIAIDNTTGQLDWTPLDRVFATAAAYHQRLIVVLAGQGSGCDRFHWQDPSWYNGGFFDAFTSAATSSGRGAAPLSYWDYLQDVVTRYRSSPALGMWEPISEPQASTCPAQDEPANCSGNQTCPDETVAAHALRHFFDVVGGEIHQLDPDHLVESGFLGAGECGLADGDYQYVGASPGIDVLSYHDYYPASEPLGGDQFNGIAVRLDQARALDKPIIAGELGIGAGPVADCQTPEQRAVEFAAKVQAQLAAGSSGVLAWNWVPSGGSSCSYDTFPGDPLMAAISAST